MARLKSHLRVDLWGAVAPPSPRVPGMGRAVTVPSPHPRGATRGTLATEETGAGKALVLPAFSDHLAAPPCSPPPAPGTRAEPPRPRQVGERGHVEGNAPLSWPLAQAQGHREEAPTPQGGDAAGVRGQGPAAREASGHSLAGGLQREPKHRTPGTSPTEDIPDA